MGASLDAIHAQRAVHVAGLLWHIELQLAAALLLISGNAVMGGATIAGCLAARLEGEGRKQRTSEIELPQRANIFAEAGSAKEGVHQEGRGEVGDQKPRGALGMVPEAKAS